MNYSSCLKKITKTDDISIFMNFRISIWKSRKHSFISMLRQNDFIN